MMTTIVDNSQIIHGIFNWCDRWCERCNQTKRCTLYTTTAYLPADNHTNLFESLSTIFNTTMDMLREHAMKLGLDLDSSKKSDYMDEYNRKKNEISNDKGILLAKQYGKQVQHWIDSLQKKESFGVEIRLQDPMLFDCIEIIQWYQYLFEVKLSRALMSQKDEEEEQTNAYDSLGIAKLMLISIERNIGAWGYVYQKFQEDEDEILDILICLQRLGKTVEENFPDASTFIRPGLD